MRRAFTATTVAIAAAGTLCLAAPGQAEEARTAALAGKTEIREVKLLEITRGTDRGSLLLWADVRHAALPPGTAAAPGATHTGRLKVRIEGAGKRGDSHPLSLSSTGLAHGYRVRIPARRADEVLGDGDRVSVGVRATQQLDATGDGDAEATRSDRERESLEAERVAGTIDPESGSYALAGGRLSFPPGFDIRGNDVTDFDAILERTNPCPLIGSSTAPIDPETGSFEYSVPAIPPGVDKQPQVTLQGQVLSTGIFVYVPTGQVTFYKGGAVCAQVTLDNTGWPRLGP